MLVKNNKPEISAELQNEVTNLPLTVFGNIPTWLSGTLMRNGPINVTANGESKAHWFDGLAMLHAFSFHNGMANYTNKFLRSDAYNTVFKDGSIKYAGFASDPCRSLFQKFLIWFIPNNHAEINNANVNVAKIADKYVALTELPLPVEFDLKTLDTLGVFDYHDQLSKEKCWESAHPHYDFHKKETLNYLITYGRTSCYTLYKIKDGFSERKIIARIPVEEPAYMHSFAVTENYIIFTEFPFVVKPLDLLIKGQPFIKNFAWKSEKGTQIIVINRHDGNIVGKYTTKSFFSFHHANAFEKDDIIHMDIVTYENANIITGKYLYFDFNQESDNNSQSKLERFYLSLKDGKVRSEILLSKSIEFPRINDAFDGHFYHYVYVAGFNNEITNQPQEVLYKVNTITKEILIWSEKGCISGEPVFVASPKGKDEDDGVVLAVILDTINHSSFLLILDGKTFKEIGRAQAPHMIPKDLHGQYFHQ